MTRFFLSILFIASAAVPLRAESRVTSQIVWTDGKPHLEVTIDATAPEGLREVAVPVNLFDAKNVRLWQGTLVVPVATERPWRGRLAIEKIAEPTKQHRVELELWSAEFKLDYGAKIFFAAESTAVQSYGVATEGVFPSRKIFFTVGLNGFKGRDLKEIPVALTIRDGDDNAVLNRQANIPPAEAPAQHRIDISPDTATAVGPFTLEATIDSDAHSIFFSTTQRFAQPNSLLPISSMEHGSKNLWFAHSAPVPKDGWLEMYYSEHLRDLVPQDYPHISYDRTQHHSGRQSLKIDYDSAREARVWSQQELPGKAVMLHVWVQGNGSPDQLVVHFHDRINFTLPAWFRNSNFESVPLCTLDFSGWREFTVPVQGRGLQASGTKGSTPEIDGPVRILAISVKPARLPKGVTQGEPRSVWIDDLSVETQLATTELLTMELQTSQPDGVLTPDGKLAVSVGNGHAVDLKKAKLNLSARDVDGKPILTQSLDLPAPAQAFASTEVPLAELAARNAPGPIELDVSLVDPTVSGARITRRFTFKNPKQAGLFQDFEAPTTFSGYQPGKVTPPVATIATGGAQGSANSLAISVQPKQENNSVLFHPALPGEVDHIEMMVKGGPKPITLQPWFIDSGATGVWLRNYNLFWAQPITVDWQDWRKVTVPAPPIPAHHGEKNRAFLYQAWYPLNLALNATLVEDGEQSSELRIDNVRVVTHLPPAEQLKMEVEYPDETRIHAPGSPLRIALSSYAGAATKLPLEFELHNYQGFIAERGKLDVNLPAGGKQRLTLAPSLKPGIYDLVVRGLAAAESRTCIMVLDAKQYFGPEPLALMTDPLQLRRKLGLMTEKLYLDWDNTEPAPYLHHFNWFEQELKKRKEVAVLPPALEAVAARNDAAVAALAQADKDMRAAQGQLAPTAGAVKAAESKVASSIKAIDAPKMAAEMAAKALDATKQKAEAAMKAATAEQEKATTAKTAADKLEADAKQAATVAATAAKALADAEKASKDAEAALKPLDQALMAADKDFQAAEAAAVKAEADAKDADEATKEAKAKLATTARAKADEAKKKLDAARTKVDEARKAAETKRATAASAKTVADRAKSEADAFAPKAQTARTVATTAAKQAMTATMMANAAKGDLTRAEQSSQAAAKKLADTEKTLENDRQTLTDKQKAAAEAIAALEQFVNAVKSARAEASAAAKALDEAKAPYALRVMPVVGFTADWAGPEAGEALRKGIYRRWIPNMLQVPERLVDWSLFVRAVQREYKGRFQDWVFWENPDLEQAPQSIPPERYPALLEVFHRWVKLYNPQARVVAGGFNFDKVIEYLARIPNPDKLPLDEIAVQVNLGELSPEHADLEGFLDDLNDLLKLRETNRAVGITELDWGIGPYVSAVEQAAFHARAALILNSRGASPHQFSLINSGFAFEGYGVFYRVSYGNTAELQTYKPYYVPKPSYFALVETQKFLQDWKYVTSVNLSGRSLADNRAFIYQNAAGNLTAVAWRAVDGARKFRLPAQWSGVTARDVFGFGVTFAGGLNCSALPTLLAMPVGYKLDQLVEDLRMLEAADGSYPVVLDMHQGEPEALRRAGYQSTGTTRQVVRAGTIPGGIKVREPYVEGLESESFTFNARQSGNTLLRRRWYFDKGGLKLTVQLNDGSPQSWTLTEGQGNEPGVRESTVVLRGCRAGENRVVLRYEKPGNSACYRLEPMPADHIPLVRWGAINSRQTKGRFLTHTSAVGTPLTIGKTGYEDGIGAHAVSFIEYPLDGQFQKFEVTVGIDGSTEGRGSVVFRVYVDGKPRADSGVVNGFAKPQTLTVDKLEGAQRMILSVMDAGDGDRHDLANWVDGKLYLKD